MGRTAAALAVACTLTGATPMTFAQEDGNAARQAEGVLRKYCYRCHGENGSKKGGMDFILDAAKLLEAKKVVAKDLDGSALFTLVKSGEMPPEGTKLRPQADDIAILEKWIREGAPEFVAQGPAARSFVEENAVVSAIVADLRKAPQQDRQFLRYFTFTHLHNNPKRTDADLRLARAALSKTINSLSWEPDLVIPRAVDKDAVVLAADLRHLGWHRHAAWRRILKEYPYGLKYDQAPDRRLREAAKELVQLMESGGSDVALPAIRADWFIATATRPPLYYDLLRLPQTTAELERRLGVDATANFLDNRLARAGFTKSGVSRQNRLVERHAAPNGAYYWKSYDFKTNAGRGNLFQFPLGPAFRGNQFADMAFAQDGGEMIFGLPNGMQAYFLVDGQDRRIDAGPTEVVSDPEETSGSVAIVNGLSCMACHKHGMIVEFKDDVRPGHALGGAAREKVEDLYPETAEMNRHLERDRRRFLAAADEATGPFLKVGPHRGKAITDFKEPIGSTARLFLKDELSLDEAAAELGVRDPKMLAVALRDPALRQLGLGPLTQNGTIKREAWETLQFLWSPFQEAAQRLDIGKPVRVR